jgi:hypothetical protein
MLFFVVVVAIVMGAVNISAFVRLGCSLSYVVFGFSRTRST